MLPLLSQANPDHHGRQGYPRSNNGSEKYRTRLAAATVGIHSGDYGPTTDNAEFGGIRELDTAADARAIIPIKIPRVCSSRWLRRLSRGRAILAGHLYVFVKRISLRAGRPRSELCSKLITSTDAMIDKKKIQFAGINPRLTFEVLSTAGSTHGENRERRTVRIALANALCISASTAELRPRKSGAPGSAIESIPNHMHGTRAFPLRGCLCRSGRESVPF
ncbi:MAG: hypothetical protein ABI411_20815 [Tahibacter sp.]